MADFPTSISPDGVTLAFIRQNADTSGDVYVLPLRGEFQAHAVVIRAFPGPDRKRPVSTEGGTHPIWNRNGKELFYRNGNKMMVVDVSTRPDLTLSQPRLLFERQFAFQTTTIASHDVSPDGQRFVMVKDASDSGRLNVVLNWFDELTRLVPKR